MILRTWWKDRSGQLQSGAETRLCLPRASSTHLSSTSPPRAPLPPWERGGDKYAPSPGVFSWGLNWWNQDGETSNTLHFCVSFPLLPWLADFLVSIYSVDFSLSLFFLPKNLRWKVLKTRSCLAVVHTGCDSVTHKFIPGCPVVICLPSGAEGWELTSHEKNTESFRLLRILFILFLREFKAPPRTLIFPQKNTFIPISQIPK